MQIDEDNPVDKGPAASAPIVDKRKAIMIDNSDGDDWAIPIDVSVEKSSALLWGPPIYIQWSGLQVLITLNI